MGGRPLKIAGAEKKRNALNLERARQLLVSDVARAYYTILELERELTILQSLRGTLLKRGAELRERIRLGKSRESEALTTESELAMSEADAERIRGQILVARDTLGFLISTV